MRPNPHTHTHTHTHTHAHSGDTSSKEDVWGADDAHSGGASSEGDLWDAGDHDEAGFVSDDPDDMFVYNDDDEATFEYDTNCGFTTSPNPNSPHPLHLHAQPSSNPALFARDPHG